MNIKIPFLKHQPFMLSLFHLQHTLTPSHFLKEKHDSEIKYNAVIGVKVNGRMVSGQIVRETSSRVLLNSFNIVCSKYDSLFYREIKS